MTDGIWSDLDHAADRKERERPPSSRSRPIRRNLQREYLRRLGDDGPRRAARARTATCSATSCSSAAAARRCRPTPVRWRGLHLKEIAGRIGKVLDHQDLTI